MTVLALITTARCPLLLCAWLLYSAVWFWNEPTREATWRNNGIYESKAQCEQMAKALLAGAEKVEAMHSGNGRPYATTRVSCLPAGEKP